MIGNVSLIYLSSVLLALPTFFLMLCLTTTKIDGYIISESARICIVLELTCPMEENLVKQHSFKQRKYEELASEAAQNGWRFEKLIVEVGARGFVPSCLQSPDSVGYQS